MNSTLERVDRPASRLSDLPISAYRTALHNVQPSPFACSDDPNPIYSYLVLVMMTPPY